jgi:succinate dehydrogenase / fumarate reductase membrane anchor subunit
MKIHYGTAIGALFLTVIHIMMRLTQNFHESLAYENVIANYESVGYALLLELLLILISVHGFNGLRVILLEMNQGPTYETVVHFSIGTTKSSNLSSEFTFGLLRLIFNLIDFVEETTV